MEIFGWSTQMRVTISRRLAIPVKQPSNPRQHPCKLEIIKKNFSTNVEAKTSAQEMRPSLRASWRAHPPRSPPGRGKKLLLNQDVKCSYLHLPLWWRFHPRKGTNPHCSWRKWCSPLPNSCGKIVSSLTCSILPHDRCPRRRPWLCPSLPIHIFVDLTN